MRLARCVVLLLCVTAGATQSPTTAAQAAESSQSASVDDDDDYAPSSSFHSDTSAGSPTGGPMMVLSAGQLSSQLLSSTGIDDDTPVEVFSSYAAAQPQLAFALRPDATPGATAFASVLVAPKLQQPNQPDAAGGGFSTFDLDDADALGPRTQLYYNCTATHRITDLLQDANVEALVSFQLTNSSSTIGNNATNVSASATLQLHDCTDLGNVSVGQLLTRNAFFGDDVTAAAAKWPFRVTTSHVVSRSTGDDTTACVVAVELVQATLSDVYPNCRVKFSSTDVSALAQAASASAITPTNASHHEATRRRLGASSFEFLKHPLCYFGCGYFSDDEGDECRTLSYDKLSCTIQFYEAPWDCSNECGDDDLRPSQCLSSSDSYWAVWSWPCDPGYVASSLVGCARIISCRAISEAAVAPTKPLAWNLDASGSVIASERVLYESGDCADPTDPRSDCCRITCEDCYIDLDVASVYADVDLDTSVDAHVKVVGNSSITFAIYAPTGCYFTTGDQEIIPEMSISIPWYGIDIELSGSLASRLDFELKPRGSLARYGWATTIQARAGTLDSTSFKDIVLETTANRAIGSSAIDVSGTYTLITMVGSKVKLGEYIGVGATVEWETYSRLDASVSFPDPFPPRLAAAYNPKSWLKYGDCLAPHFMAFEGTVGFREASASLVLTLPVKGDMTLGTMSFSPVSKSVFSGCIATAYEAQLLLVTAIDKALQLMADDEKQRRLKRLLAWALGVTDIDVTAIAISSVSNVDGSIVISLQVPPSVSDLYPSASDLQLQLYDRARTTVFRDLMTSEVGLQVASTCDDGWWGPSCSERCYAPTCRSVASCNAVDGAVVLCDACATGYWGPTCEFTCQDDGYHQCASGTRSCNQVSGLFEACEACAAGYWRDGCTDECASSATCTSPSCARYSGTIESCAACTSGYWGTTCQQACPDDGVHRCATDALVCTQDDGRFSSCTRCRQGYWGDDCTSTCHGPTGCSAPGCARWSGNVEACESCVTGYWGVTCTNQCAASDGTHRCAAGAAVCTQYSGNVVSCDACLDGYWRDDCSSPCPSSSECVSPTCTRFGGATIACRACAQGFYGADCASTCTLPPHCASVVCAQATGAVGSCPVCLEGYKGATCDEQTATTGTSASVKSVAAFALQLVLAAVVAAVALSRR